MRIEFEFEELPLVVVGEYEGALIWGKADIVGGQYGWRVEAIYVRGFGKTDSRKWIELSNTSDLYFTVSDRLSEGRWQESIQSKWDDHLVAEREEATERRWEDRRHEP